MFQSISFIKKIRALSNSFQLPPTQNFRFLLFTTNFWSRQTRLWIGLLYNLKKESAKCCQPNKTKMEYLRVRVLVVSLPWPLPKRGGPSPVVLPANQKELHWKARLVHPGSNGNYKTNQEWRKGFLGRWRNIGPPFCFCMLANSCCCCCSR